MNRLLPFVREAIARLKYVKPEYDTSLAILLEQYEGRHPREMARTYRSLGPQLTTLEKRARGIQPNAFFSKEAWESLTPLGQAEPMVSHEHVLLDATFIYSRHTIIEQSKRAGYLRLYVHSAGYKDCPGCKEMHGAMVTIEHAKNIRPHSCTKEACGLSVSRNWA